MKYKKGDTKRVSFYELFQEDANGFMYPRQALSINGINFSQGRDPLYAQNGISYGGVNFRELKDRDFAVKVLNMVCQAS